MSIIAKLPYYAFIAWAGLVTFIVLITQNFFEYAAVVGWCLIAGSILAFYLFTIEAPTVKCEWAGWILSPALVLIIFTGVEFMTAVLWILSVLAIAYSATMYRCERDPEFAEKMPRFLRPVSPSGPKKTEESQSNLDEPATVSHEAV